MVGIEQNREAVRFSILIAPRELTGNAPGTSILQAYPHVERVVVVGDPQLGGFARRLAFVRLTLRELGGGGCGEPHFVVEPAVHDDGRRGADGLDSRHRAVRRPLPRGNDRCGGAGQDEHHTGRGHPEREERPHRLTFDEPAGAIVWVSGKAGIRAERRWPLMIPRTESTDFTSAFSRPAWTLPRPQRSFAVVFRRRCSLRPVRFSVPIRSSPSSAPEAWARCIAPATHGSSVRSRSR